MQMYSINFILQTKTSAKIFIIMAVISSVKKIKVSSKAF